MAIDWDGVRATALDCLNATWSMDCWAARSQEDDYDTEKAALHLAAMDTALNTFRLALEILQPGLECATSDLRHSPVFDALAVASVGEGPRPDFKLCATAHEKAFQLLRMAILRVENGLNDELDRRGAPDSHLLGIDDLHRQSASQLSDTLRCLGKNSSSESILTARQLHELRAWIDREWAAVSDVHPKKRNKPEKPQGQVKTTRKTPNKELDSAIQKIVQKLFPEGQRRRTADIALHIYQENESKTKNPEKHIEIAYLALWPKEIQNKPEGPVLDSACKKIRASLNRIDALASKIR
jgi:hypothetical protein